MNTSAAATDQVDLEATGRGSHRSRMDRVGRRLRVGLAVMVLGAGISATAAAPAFAAVSDGSGSADETVFCNSITHTITITTNSVGIPSNQLVSSPGGLINYFLNYPVWLRMQEYVDGAWRAAKPWVQVTDGSHQIQFPERAGATSYWYFTWAFQTASGRIDYGSEWAGGYNPYGWYSDQRGYKTLTSCRS
jgi:hypothetical protein